MKPFNILCPFHEERTPSFRIWSNGNFYCHGCNVKGNIINYDFLKIMVLRKETEYKESKGQLILCQFQSS